MAAVDSSALYTAGNTDLLFISRKNYYDADLKLNNKMEQALQDTGQQSTCNSPQLCRFKGTALANLLQAHYN